MSWIRFPSGGLSGRSGDSGVLLDEESHGPELEGPKAHTTTPNAFGEVRDVLVASAQSGEAHAAS